MRRSLFFKMNIFFSAIVLVVDIEVHASDSPEVYDDRIFSSTIKTVLLDPEDTSLHYPVLILNRENQLKLSFDDFRKDDAEYYCRFVHCNSDWTPSSLIPENFSEAIGADSVDSIHEGIRLGSDYIHYTHAITGNQFRFKQSGNYLLCVYRDSIITTLAFTRRMWVVDERSSVNAQVIQSRLAEFKKNSQEIEVLVSLKDSLIKNPFSEIVLYVYQNGRKDNALNNISPSGVINNEVYFKNSFENIFAGGNEFRSFSMKMLKEKEYNRVDTIKLRDDGVHFSVAPDLRRSNLQYQFTSDQDGRFEVFPDKNVKEPLRYGWASFTLNADNKFDGGEVYVIGDFCNWNFTEANRMLYDSLANAYKGSLFLKNGRYDYQYVFLPDTSTIAETYVIEGDHYETENEYIVYVYYKPPNSSIHQLIGFSKFTSDLR